MSARKLTPAEEEIAFEYGISGISLTKTALDLGFKSDMDFFYYRRRNPDFSKALDDVRNASCDHMEDKIISVADDYMDPQQARVKMESLCRVLAYRKPERYGNRIDMNVNQTVSVRANLEAANQRVSALMVRDVVPLLQESKDIDDIL